MLSVPVLTGPVILFYFTLASQKPGIFSRLRCPPVTVGWKYTRGYEGKLFDRTPGKLLDLLELFNRVRRKSFMHTIREKFPERSDFFCRARKQHIVSGAGKISGKNIEWTDLVGIRKETGIYSGSHGDHTVGGFPHGCVWRSSSVSMACGPARRKEDFNKAYQS